MKKPNKIILFLILLFGGLILLRFITPQPVSSRRLSSRGMVEKVVVKVMPVKREDLNFVLAYVGSLKAKDEISVFSKVSGKLVEYTVNEGEPIQKGETLALIDRDETGLKYELAPVESPISGIVGRTLLDKGANVLPSSGVTGGSPLAIIVNMDEMIVRLNIPEPDIPYIKKGLKANIKVDAYPDDNFVGEISKVSEVVDTQTRTLPIEIIIPNKDHRLKSGMFCRINIIASQHKDSLVILQDALVQEIGQNYVFIVQDHTAKKRKVALGTREDNRIEVLEGLEVGQKVIVFGQHGLKDGTSVELIEE